MYNIIVQYNIIIVCVIICFIIINMKAAADVIQIKPLLCVCVTAEGTHSHSIVEQENSDRTGMIRTHRLALLQGIHKIILNNWVLLS